MRLRERGSEDADGPVIPARAKATSRALTQLRRICVVIFEEMEQHPWVAPQLIGSDDVRENSLRLWDAMGQQLMPLELTPLEQFYASGTLMNYVNGVAAAMDDQDRRVAASGGESREEIIDAEIENWFASVPRGLPFVESMLESFRVHSEAEQFEFGLDVVLAGIRSVVERAR